MCIRDRSKKLQRRAAPGPKCIRMTLGVHTAMVRTIMKSTEQVQDGAERGAQDDALDEAAGEAEDGEDTRGEDAGEVQGGAGREAELEAPAKGAKQVQPRPPVQGRHTPGTCPAMNRKKSTMIQTSIK
eukprot:11476614-Alexandrium_andersonii.AAC.1